MVELQSQCQELSTTLENVVEGEELLSQIEFFVHLANRQQINTAIDNLQYFFTQKTTDSLPNFRALKINATMPDSIATCEPCFSKLKLIRAYLRSTMGHDRLNGLTMMSIEKDISGDIDFNEIIDQFALKKARRQNFNQLVLKLIQLIARAL